VAKTWVLLVCLPEHAAAAAGPSLAVESPAAANDELGQCWHCSVSACSTHGTRYGQFECAICSPAAAAQQALAGPPPPPPAPTAPEPTSPAGSLARLVGERATQDQIARANTAAARIQADHAQMGYPTVTFAPAPGRPGNLVGDFASVLRAHGVPEFVRGVSADAEPPSYMLDREVPETSLSIDAVAATVRQSFSRWTPAPTKGETGVCRGRSASARDDDC
jgi:hypothetical protein